MHAKRQTHVKKMRSLRLNSRGHPHTVFPRSGRKGNWIAQLDNNRSGAGVNKAGSSGVEPYAEVQRLSRRTVSPTIVVIRFRICGHA
jgi:hypothetical protein